MASDVKDRDLIIARLRREADGSFSTIYRALSNAAKKSGSTGMRVEDVEKEIRTLARPQRRPAPKKASKGSAVRKAG